MVFFFGIGVLLPIVLMENYKKEPDLNAPVKIEIELYQHMSLASLHPKYKGEFTDFASILTSRSCKKEDVLPFGTEPTRRNLEDEQPATTTEGESTTDPETDTPPATEGETTEGGEETPSEDAEPV